jgi:hypothetical protein
VSGSLHVIKTEEFAKRLSDEEFVCVAGWIDRFKLSRIAFGKMRGQSRDVNGDTTKWRNVVWPNVRAEGMQTTIF